VKIKKQLCRHCSDQSASEHPIFDLCRANRFDEALAICQREIASRPNEPSGYRHAASVLQQMDRHAEARPFRDKVVELAPDAMSYYSRADLLYEMGEYAAAIPDFTRSAELDREQALGAANFLYRADCHRRLGNLAEAIADCARIPDDYDFPGFLGYRNGSKSHLLAEIARDRNAAR
jgi:tetratricopeptide (TPR) repeat protein